MKDQRKRIYDKYSGKCAYCGCDLNGKFQIDHIIPKERFWSVVKTGVFVPDFLKHLSESDVNHPDNLMPACGSCNNYKSVHLLEEFRNQISLLVGRLNNTATIYKISKRFGLIEEKPIEVKFHFETASK